jgi:transketolase
MTGMRPQLAATAVDLFERDERVVIVLAEISTDLFDSVVRRDPARAVNVGIMEQTMIGVAAGFAMEGFHPIVHTLAPFLTERPFEQLKVDFCYQALGGTFASVGASYDYGAEGGTHHSPADVAVMLAIPGVEVLVPGSAPEVDALLRATYANGRPTYVRGSSAQNTRAFDVAPGRMEVLRWGSRATVVAVGPLLTRTLAACEGLDITLLYATSVRPFDMRTLVASVTDAPVVVTVEPFFEGTLVPSVAEALRHLPTRITSVGVPRRFIRSYGSLEEHDAELGMDTAGIRRRIVDAVAS